MLIFVNERPVEVPDRTSAAEAIAASEPELAAELGSGRVLATDGVGRAIDLQTPLAPGAILKVRRSARCGGAAE